MPATRERERVGDDHSADAAGVTHADEFLTECRDHQDNEANSSPGGGLPRDDLV